MTASRRYLPASLACLLTLSAGSAGFASGGSALDPYAGINAPTSLKGSKKDEKGKKKFNVPIVKKAQAEEKLVQDDANQSQTYVKMPGGGKSKKQKEVTFAPETKPEKQAKVKKAAAPPVPSTTKVSDIAPAPSSSPSKEKAPVVSGQGDESVMGGIKQIGQGYSKTFKAATHGMMHSTKAASSAVMSSSKKMTDGIKNGAKASGDVFKKGAGVVGLGFKATGDKIKDGAAPLTNKIAKSPDAAKAPKADKADKASKDDKSVKIAAKAKKETPITDEPEVKHGLGSKLAHFPKPKMPKIGIPFVGGKKKAPVVDAQAGASEQGTPAPETNLAATAKPAPAAKPAPKETPIVDTPIETAQVKETPKDKPKAKDKDKSKGASQGLAAMPGNAVKKIGKLWPFGHKAAAATDVAGKQTPPPL